MSRNLMIGFVCVIALVGWAYDRDIPRADAEVPTGGGGGGGSRVDCNGNGIPDGVEFGPLPGHALYFDGLYDYLEPQSMAELAALGQGDFTLEAWVWSEDTTHSIIIGNGGGEWRFFWNFVIREGGIVRITIGDGGDEKDCSGSTSITDGTWHHVAVVRRVGEDGSLDVIIDGVVDSYELVANAPFTADNPTFIARDARPNPPFFGGALDDLRVWNVARSPAQIAADMHRVLNGTEPGLLAYWRFDEGTGLFTYDSADDNDCELISDPKWAPINADCNENDEIDECEVGGLEDCNTNGTPDLCDIHGGTSPDCNGNGIPDECEVGGTEDCNTNGLPDLCDIHNGTSADCNGNDIPDECDIADGTSQDCNANDVPDECDIASGASEDCNANDVPDECDIAAGTSEDCNANGIPDECEPDEDCNTNGVQDICDIAAGTSQDCNGNGVPDECDIADETSPDCNANGVPDECEIGGTEDCNTNGTPDLCDIFNGTSVDSDGDGIPDECERVHNVTQGTIHPTIQEGIDEAVAGDEIEVGAGTYHECITLRGKAITLRGAGSDETMIDVGYDVGVDCMYAVKCEQGEGPDTVIEGFAVANLGQNGMRNVNSSPTLIDCVFTECDWLNGGMYNSDSHPTLINCVFRENSEHGMINSRSHPTLINCIFDRNWGGDGAGMSNHESNPTLVNCVFVGNETRGDVGGGGMYNVSSSPTLINCTFTDNEARFYGDAIFTHGDSHPTLTNCIVWGNTPWHASQIYNDEIGGTSTTTVTYSCIQQGWPGVGNTNANPYLDGAHHLCFGSSCIDAGNNAALPPDTHDLDGDGDVTEPLPLDVDGRERFFGDPPIVDMGACECQPATPELLGDLDGDCDVDLSDLAELLAHYGEVCGG